MPTLIRILLLCLCFCTNLWAEDAPIAWYTLGKDKAVTINVELFLSSTCPHCHKEEAFFKTLEANNPWLRITRYYINDDKNALIRFNQLLTRENSVDFSVPASFFCDSRWVGFSDANTTGKDILHALNYCKTKIEEKGELSLATVSVLQNLANANHFNASMVDAPSPFYYILGMAFIDATGPCSLFFFLCFLAMLSLQKTPKNQCITGAIFIITLGVLHFLQQVYISTFFEFIAWLRFPVALIGLFVLYLAGRAYKKQATNGALFLLAFLLAFAVQVYQQTCVMNWSYLFEQWLNNQSVTSLQRATYEVFYQLVYLAPLILFLIAYIAAMKRDKFNAYLRIIQSLSSFVLLFVALILIVYPQGLSSLSLSLLLTATLPLYAWYVVKMKDSM